MVMPLVIAGSTGFFRPSLPLYSAGNLKVFKDKVTLYSKLEKIIRTVKTVTLAKFMKAQDRVHSRDQSMRFTRKAFLLEQFNKPFSPAENVLIVPITTNRGSCGAMNSRISKHITDLHNSGAKIQVVVWGKRGYDSIPRLVPEIVQRGVVVDSGVGPAAVQILAEHCLSLRWDRMRILFTRFHSAGSQEFSQLIIPSFETFRKTVEEMSLGSDAPDGEINNLRFHNALLSLSDSELLDFYEFHVALALFHAIEDNGLSELALRMGAVESQLQNIIKLKTFMQNIYNKTRQASVTAEMLELSNAKSAADSLKMAEERAKKAAMKGFGVVAPQVLKDWIADLEVEIREADVTVRLAEMRRDPNALAAAKKRVAEMKKDLEVLKANSGAEVGMTQEDWIEFVKGYETVKAERKLKIRYDEILAGLRGFQEPVAPAFGLPPPPPAQPAQPTTTPTKSKKKKQHQ